MKNLYYTVSILMDGGEDMQPTGNKMISVYDLLITEAHPKGFLDQILDLEIGYEESSTEVIIERIKEYTDKDNVRLIIL